MRTLKNEVNWDIRVHSQKESWNPSLFGILFHNVTSTHAHIAIYEPSSGLLSGPVQCFWDFQTPNDEANKSHFFYKVSLSYDSNTKWTNIIANPAVVGKFWHLWTEAPMHQLGNIWSIVEDEGQLRRLLLIQCLGHES